MDDPSVREVGPRADHAGAYNQYFGLNTDEVNAQFTIERSRPPVHQRLTVANWGRTISRIG
jgi:hypothetical protein